jgi:uncharacterized membrane protein
MHLRVYTLGEGVLIARINILQHGVMCASTKIVVLVLYVWQCLRFGYYENYSLTSLILAFFSMILLLLALLYKVTSTKGDSAP